MTADEKCKRLHELFNAMYRHKFEEADINGLKFYDGVYIVFEEGEKAHGGCRIVRAGSHKESGRLQKRLHLHRRNSGASVFRKEVGCAILNKANSNDPNIYNWYREKYYLIDPTDLACIRQQVTGHIVGKTSFVAFNVGDARFFWEKKLIATIAQCPQCRQSEQWLGNSIPTNLGDLKKVKACGMWLVQGINGSPLTDSELCKLESIVKASMQKYDTRA